MNIGLSLAKEIREGIEKETLPLPKGEALRKLNKVLLHYGLKPIKPS